MISCHARACHRVPVSLFEGYVKGCENVALKAWTEAQLSTLQTPEDGAAKRLQIEHFVTAARCRHRSPFTRRFGSGKAYPVISFDFIPWA